MDTLSAEGLAFQCKMAFTKSSRYVDVSASTTENVLGMMLKLSSTRLSAETATLFTRRFDVVTGFCASLLEANRMRTHKINMRPESVNYSGFGCFVKMPFFNGET